MTVRIHGIGVVGSFGSGIQSLEKAAIRQNPHFAELLQKNTVPVAPPDAPPDAPAPAAKKPAADTALLGRFFPPKALRRVDHYSRMAILASFLALQDAKKAEGMDKDLPGPVGVIVATGMGPTAGTLDSQSPDAPAADLRLSPIVFSNSVHNAAAAYISMLLNIRGPNLSINHFDMSVPLAFQTAMDWLDEGRAATVLVGGVDCAVNGPDAAALPDTTDGESSPGTVPAGEGSAFFVLARTGEKNTRYPSIRDVRIGRRLGDILPPAALYLHDGGAETAALIGDAAPRAVFSRIYGAFPTAMALDLAVAALLLKQDTGPDALPAQVDLYPDFAKTPRICCLKKGAAGDIGMIEVAGNT